MPPSATIVVRFMGDAAGFLSEAQRIGTSIDKMAGHMRASAYLMNQMGFGMMALGTTIGGPIIKGTKAAMELETQIAQINTIMSETNRMGTAELTAGLDRISTTLGIDVVRAARAAYDALSSAIPAENLLSFVEVAGKSAIAGVSDIDTSVKVLASVINAYGDKLAQYGDVTERAAHVSDVLFQAVNLGVLTYEDLASQLGDVVSTAANAGVSLEELAAAFATITLKGVSSAETATSVNNMLIQLISPAKDARAAMDDLGIEFRKFNDGSMTLTEILAQIIEKTGGLSSKMTEIFPNIRAFRAGINLSTGDGVRWRETLAAMYNVAGLTDHAFNIMADTMEKKVDRTIQLVNKSMRDLGNAVMPLVNDALTYVNEKMALFSDYVAENNKEVVAYTQSIAKFAAGLFGGGLALIYLGQVWLSLSALLTAAKTILATTGATIQALNAAIAAESLGLLGSLGAWALVIGALQLAGFFIYADVKMFQLLRKSQDEVKESTKRLSAATEEFVISLQKRGIEVNRAILAELSADQQREYLLVLQKKRDGESVESYVNAAMKKRYADNDSAMVHIMTIGAIKQAQNIALNEWVSAEEAARAAIEIEDIELKTKLKNASREETDVILNQVGIRTEARTDAWYATQDLLSKEIHAIKNMNATEQELTDARTMMREQDLTERQAVLAMLGEFTAAEIAMMRTATDEELTRHAERIRMEQEYRQETNLNLDQKYAIIDATANQHKMDKLTADEKWTITELAAKHEVGLATATLLAKKELSIEEMKMVQEGVEWREIMEKRLEASLAEEEAAEDKSAQEVIDSWRKKRGGIQQEADAINTQLIWMQQELAKEAKANGKNSEESIAAYHAKKAEHAKLVAALDAGDTAYTQAMQKNWYDQLDIYMQQQKAQAEAIWGADKVKAQMGKLVESGGEFVGQFLQFSNGITTWWSQTTATWDTMSGAQRANIRRVVGDLPEYHQAIQAAWGALTDEQRDKLRIMDAQLEQWGYTSEQRVELFVNSLRHQGKEAHDAWFKFAPSTPGSPAPSDVFNQDVDNMVSKMGYLSTQTQTALATMHGMWIGFVQSIEDIVKRVYDAYQWVNPWATHSPSLVDQVDSGTDTMREMWAKRARDMAISVLKMYKDILYYQERGMIKVAWAFDIDPNTGERSVNYDRSYFLSKPKDLDLSMEEYVKFLYDMEELERARLRSKGVDERYLESRDHVRTPSDTTGIFLGNLLKEIFGTETVEDAAEIYFKELVDRIKGRNEELDVIQKELQDELIDTIAQSGNTLSTSIKKVSDDVTAAFKAPELISAMQGFVRLLNTRSAAGGYGALSTFPIGETLPIDSLPAPSGGIAGGAVGAGQGNPNSDDLADEDKLRERLRQALEETRRMQNESNRLAKLNAMRTMAVQRIYAAIAADAELLTAFKNEDHLARDQKLDYLISKLIYADTDEAMDNLALTMEDFREILRDILRLKPLEDAINTVEQITEDVQSTTTEARNISQDAKRISAPKPPRRPPPPRDQRWPREDPPVVGGGPPVEQDTSWNPSLNVRLGGLLKDRYFQSLMKDKKWTSADVFKRMMAKYGSDELASMSDSELIEAIKTVLGMPQTLNSLLLSLGHQYGSGGLAAMPRMEISSGGVDPMSGVRRIPRSLVRTPDSLRAESELFGGRAINQFTNTQIDRFAGGGMGDGGMESGFGGGGSPVITNINIENIPNRETLESLVQNVTTAQARAQRRR